LSRDFTQDVNEETLGEPTHVITMETGDLLYFPRGVIYQCKAKEQGHSTHVTISTYQEHSWGDFMVHAVQQAIETALENDVRIRAGLPINFRGFLGTANNMGAYVAEEEKEAKDGAPKAEHSSNMSDDRVVKFKEDMQKRLSYLVDHIDVNKSADAMSADFMASRLPPYGYCRCDGDAHDHDGITVTEVTETTSETADGSVTESTTVTTETTTKTSPVFQLTKLQLADQIRFKYPDHVRVVYVNEDDDNDDNFSDVTSQTDSQVSQEDMEDDVTTITSQEDTEKASEEAEKPSEGAEKPSESKPSDKTDDEEDDDADITETEPHIQVLHSLTNDRFTHMGFSIFAKVGRMKFDVTYAKALVALTENKGVVTRVSDLLMDSDDEKLVLANRLNSEGLLQVKSCAD